VSAKSVVKIAVRGAAKSLVRGYLNRCAAPVGLGFCAAEAETPRPWPTAALEAVDAMTGNLVFGFETNNNGNCHNVSTTVEAGSPGGRGDHPPSTVGSSQFLPLKSLGDISCAPLRTYSSFSEPGLLLVQESRSHTTQHLNIRPRSPAGRRGHG
jgi:hypothetical protein